METAIVSITLIALIIVGGMTMSQGFLSSVDSTMVGVEELSVREGEIMRTEISTINATQTASNSLDLSLRNSGQVKLSSFSKWDVIVKYYKSGSYHVTWLPYIDGSPGNNEWTVSGIYLSSENLTAEIFEPEILNPGEEMIIQAKLSPGIQKGTTCDVIVSTPNGISDALSFVGG